jgi:FkbM family methyltransferase
MARRSSSRLVLGTVLVATVLAFLSVVFLLAPHYAWAWSVRQNVVIGLWQSVKFPFFARERDSHCSLMDALLSTTPPHIRTSFVEVEGAMRPIRSEGNLEQVETPAGTFWIPKGERVALAEELDEQQSDEYGTGLSGIHPGDIVLDCGANVGTYTRRAVRAGASRVVAIEPAPWALECLRRNLSAEIAKGSVVVYPKGVWDHDDKLELTVGPGGATSAATLVLGEGGKPRLATVVPLTTIDELVAELHLPRVDFIKMDIEGAEPNALRGAVRTVAQFHPRLAISLEHRKTDSDTIPALARTLWPEYRTTCGPCSNMNGHLQPTMMFGTVPVAH